MLGLGRFGPGEILSAVRQTDGAAARATDEAWRGRPD
jgi:hypothetical protein